MKNIKAFTLIELLAVVIILSVLSFVAVPIILSVIDEVRSSAKMTSVANYAEAVRLSIKEYQFEHEGDLPEDLDDLEIKTNNNNVSCETKYMQSANSVILANCTVNGDEVPKYHYVSKKVYDDVTEFVEKITEIGLDPEIFIDSGEEPEFTIESTIDTNPGVLSGTGALTTPYLIESMEDLVALANNVNGGNNYNGKYISLTLSLDFDNPISYVDDEVITYGDINGNGTAEGLLLELTTSKGYGVIGSDTKKFRGILLGNNKYINNLYINRPDTSYVGLFGSIDDGGTIKKLNLKYIDITGGDYTGGVAGKTYQSYIYSSNVQGNITGKNNTGGIVGFMDNYGANNRGVRYVTFEGNISGTDRVGGIIGSSATMAAQYPSWVSGVNKGGTIVSTGTNVGRTAGLRSGDCQMSTLADKNITVNGTTLINSSYDNLNGYDIDNFAQVLSDINLADTALDTYIGADNDSDGYYYDYNDSGTLVLKNTTSDPLTFSLSGSGTSASPYLISSYEELKQASQKQNVYYKLANDIDLSNQTFYMLSSYANKFTGNFNGNNKTISNLTINSSGNFIGMFGYINNGATVKSLNLSDVNIIGRNYTGGIAGASYQPYIYSCNVEGDITGDNYVGGIVGDNYNSSATDRVIKYVTIEGNITGTNYVGGLIGNANGYSYMFLTSLIGMNKGGTITATGVNVGRIMGRQYDSYNDAYRAKALAVKTITINGSTISTGTINNLNGLDVDNVAEVMSNINLADIALDTYIGGDNDANGYYYDYDTNDVLVLKNTTDNPITFNLSGSGTTISPYLVNTIYDWKQINLNLTSTYELTTYIDYLGGTKYGLGSVNNLFTGQVIDIYNNTDSIYFDGSDDYISIPRMIADDFTIEFQIKTNIGGPSTTTNWYAGDGLIHAEVSGITNDLGISLNSNGQILAGTGNPDRSIYSNDRYINGIWHNIRFTRQKAIGTIKLYIDNNLVSSSATAGTQSLTAPTYINIGRVLTGINYYTGYIRNIRIWDAITSSNMNTQLNGTESNLKAYYKFNEGSGTTLTDYTSNGYNGTIYGSPVWN